MPISFVATRVSELLKHHVISDVHDLGQLIGFVPEVKSDFIFYLAAHVIVSESYRNPHATLQTIVMGTVNVLEAVRRVGVPCCVVIVTSDKCYENREQVWGYRGCDTTGGYDPYGASKSCAELVTASYQQSFFFQEILEEHGVRVASARAGSVIGGGDWARDRIMI